MAINNSAQKFIARNRAPRVQIEYDVEIYGSEKKIELPFVMAVLADLAGKPREELPPVTDRKFLDIDIDNFNERMKAIAPRVAFAVPNTLTGEGQLMVDMTLENMDDFSPAQIARKVDALNQLLEALNRPGFPGEYFTCELRLPAHHFRWKHNTLFLLLPEEYGPAFPAIVDCYTSPPTLVWPVPLLHGFSSSYGVLPPLCKDH